MRLSKKWEVYLIHHTHTDIGYTERQDKITTYHVDFIRQAIDILNRLHSGENPEYKGFVWQCENHWQIKNFYRQASQSEIEQFEAYVKSGEIGLSGNYLNMTELVGYDVLDSRLKQVKKYAETLGMPIQSGMTADINGMAWGYPDALYDNGVEHLFSCLHPHHGMFPLYKKQQPFYWETPKGNQVLVWNGEYYHFGNELGFCPHGASTYMIFDEFSDRVRNGQIFVENAGQTETEELNFLDGRLMRYLANLEEEGYAQDFIPCMVSGAITDNAPPNGKIAERVNLLNEKYGGSISFKMVTLDQFFAIVKSRCTDIPVFSGDWNDWWADGIGSTPAVVKNYRMAQRKLSLSNKLDPDVRFGDRALIEEASENMMLYAEHTWGYSSSVSEPWETMVGELELKKGAYAVNANTQISQNLDKVLRARGEVSIRADKPVRFRVMNPNHTALDTTALLFVEFWEYTDGVSFDEGVPYEIIDEQSGKVLPSQIKRIPRALQIEVQLSLKANESRDLKLRYTGIKKNLTIQNHAYIGAEGIEDLLPLNGCQEDTEQIETEFFRVRFDQSSGICSIIDKRDGQELLHPEMEHAPFSGVYEVTPMDGGAVESRRKMGRSRKAPSTKRYTSELTNMKIVENGEVFIAAELDYALEGTGFYQVFLMVYRNLPKIRARVRVHKTSVWEAENLYISLPFASEETWVDKTGCIIRPGIDQLPGSNQEFYLIQNGFVFDGAGKTVTLAVKDTPLVVFGGLESRAIRLCDGKNTELNRAPAYAWAMNNYWETNFKVDLGGFYEFDYVLALHEKEEAGTASRRNEIENEGIPAVYI